MRSSTVLAVLLFVASATFMLREVLPAPASLLQHSGQSGGSEGGRPEWKLLGQFDQQMVLYMVARNADLLVSDPAGLFGVGQCFPFPASFTLGEHAFVEGAMAALPLALTGEPILAYNFMLWVGYILAGFSMFLLVRHFTGNVAAGILAGFLLQWFPSRITDGGHPFLHTEFWLVLALLFLHRLFVSGQVRAMFGVAFFLALQALGSFYLILAVIPVVLVYVGFLVWTHPRYRVRALALTIVAGLFVAMVGAAILIPYLETREEWSVLGGRHGILLPFSSFLPGSSSFPGWVYAFLFLIGAVDRLRGPRGPRGADPRWPFLAASVVILLCATSGIGVPGTSLHLDPPWLYLKGIVPGLDAVRAPGVMVNIMWVPATVVAGYGALVVFEAVGPRVERWALAGLVLAVASIRFVPVLAEFTYGGIVSVEARHARPGQEEVALIREASPNAVIHLPMAKEGPASPDGNASFQLLLGSFSPSPSTSCYNSFSSPYAAQVGQLGSRLPTLESLEALGAIGIDTVVVHKRDAGGAPVMDKFLDWFRAQIEDSAELQSRLELVGETDRLMVYSLRPRGPVSSSESALHTGVAHGEPWREGESTTVRFWTSNRTNMVFRDSQPRGYREGEVLWVNEDGGAISRSPVRFLMPLALAPGGRIGLDIEVEPPPSDGTLLGHLRPLGKRWNGMALARVWREPPAASPAVSTPEGVVGLEETSEAVEVSEGEESSGADAARGPGS